MSTHENAACPYALQQPEKTARQNWLEFVNNTPEAEFLERVGDLNKKWIMLSFLLSQGDAHFQSHVAKWIISNELSSTEVEELKSFYSKVCFQEPLRTLYIEYVVSNFIPRAHSKVDQENLKPRLNPHAFYFSSVIQVVQRKNTSQDDMFNRMIWGFKDRDVIYLDPNEKTPHFKRRRIANSPEALSRSYYLSTLCSEHSLLPALKRMYDEKKRERKVDREFLEFEKTISDVVEVRKIEYELLHAAGLEIGQYHGYEDQKQIAAQAWEVWRERNREQAGLGMLFRTWFQTLFQNLTRWLEQ